MANISIDDLEEMSLSGQVIRTEKLLTILAQYGFETRRSGGGTSHIVFWHPDYPEIAPYGIVAGTNNTIYQHKVIDACLRVGELSKKVEHSVTTLLASDFQDASGEHETYTLPEHFEIIHGRKRSALYLRHKTYPQIATQLSGYRPGQDISEWCEYLDGRAQRLDTVLKNAVDRHDFEKLRHPNGTIVLTHPTNEEAYMVLPPFTPRLENFQSISKVEDCIASVQLYQELLDGYVEDWVTNFDLKLKSSQDGVGRNYTFSDMFGDGKRHSASIPLTKNGFFSYPDYLRFTSAIENQIWHNFKEQAHRHCGFKVRKLVDGRLHGKHAFLDIDFTVTDFLAGAHLDDKLKDYFHLPPDERHQLIDKLTGEYLERQKAHKTIFSAMDKAAEILMPLEKEFLSLTHQIGVRFILSKFKCGEISPIVLKNDKGHQVEINALILTYGDTYRPFPIDMYDGKNGYTAIKAQVPLRAIPPREELEKLRSFVCRLQTGRPDQGMVMAASPAPEFKKTGSVLELGRVRTPSTLDLLKSGTLIGLALNKD